MGLPGADGETGLPVGYERMSSFFMSLFTRDQLDQLEQLDLQDNKELE